MVAPSFERCGFGAALDRIALEARLGIGNLEFDEHLRLETDRAFIASGIPAA